MDENIVGIKINIDTDEAMDKLKMLQEQVERTTEAIRQMFQAFSPVLGEGNQSSQIDVKGFD